MSLIDDNIFFSLSFIVSFKCFYGILKILSIDNLGVWVVVGSFWMKNGWGFWRGFVFLSDVNGLFEFLLVKGYWLSIYFLSGLVEVGIRVCRCWYNIMDLWGKNRILGEIEYFDKVNIVEVMGVRKVKKYIVVILIDV